MNQTTSTFDLANDNRGMITLAGELRPNKAEIEFLNLSYNKFYVIFDECLTDEFWDRDPLYRFSRIKMAFSIYTELLQYEPIQWIIEEIRKTRPPL